MASRVAVVCCFSIALLATAATASPPVPKPRTIAVVHDYVGALAQSKNRLAWLRGDDTCPKAEIFDLRSQRAVTVSSRRGAACDHVSGAYGVLAFDGNRVLWQMGRGSNLSNYVSVFSAALGDRRTRLLGGGALSSEDPGLDYEPPFPMAGSAGRLAFFQRCESDCETWTGVKAVVGRGTRRLFAAGSVVGLASAGRRLASLDDEIGCCNESPAWSPDGTKLAWVKNGRELFVANADGSDRHLVARTAQLPSWAPDGAKLAFTHSTNTSSTVRVVNADGTSERILAAGWDPQWSPDGTKLAFTSFPGTPSVKVVDGTGERTLAAGSRPRWSPDGSAIAFVRADDVYRVNADGSQETRLTSDGVRETGAPRWSPDGKKLLVQRFAHAYLVDAINGGATVLPLPLEAGPFGSSPTWSPDGDRIAYSTVSNGVSAIAVMNADGDGARLLAAEGCLYDVEPAWSSDGTEIAFTCLHFEDGDRYRGSILVAASDGTGLHRVSGEPSGADPAWSPGRRVLAWGDGEEPYWRNAGLFTTNADGSGLTRLAGWDVASVQIRNARTGALVRSFGTRGTAVNVAMSASYVAVVVRSGAGLELRRYRTDGRLLGAAALPAGVSAHLVTMAGKTIVYPTRARIVAVDAETGKTRILVRPAAPPVGLSILGRRVVWAENLRRDRARVRALDLPG
jgi:TolB protein